ncbi:hypothetical protein [Nocardia sp. IFM 10818]
MALGDPTANLVASLNDLHMVGSAEGSVLWPVLPDWHELFAAVCGHIGDSPDAHPVTRCARALAELQAAKAMEPGMPGLAGTRLALIGSIDLWVLRNAPFVARCSESLGTVVDRMARAHLEAAAVLRSERDEEVVHAAWHALGLHAVEWTDLVYEVVYGQRRVPESSDGPPVFPVSEDPRRHREVGR